MMGVSKSSIRLFLDRYIEFICGIIILEILIEGLQVEERRYWAERQDRGAK